MFVHSIFRTTRNFAKLYICLLIQINFDASTSQFLVPILMNFVSSTVPHLNVYLFSNSKRQLFLNSAVLNFNPYPRRKLMTVVALFFFFLSYKMDIICKRWILSFFFCWIHRVSFKKQLWLVKIDKKLQIFVL